MRPFFRPDPSWVSSGRLSLRGGLGAALLVLSPFSYSAVLGVGGAHRACVLPSALR